MFNELEVVEGMELDKSHISPYFVTNAKTQKVMSTNEHWALSNPKILPIWCYFGCQPCMI
jgi:chaperonin GroEL (HSP60 family)